jgi:hypothetical protein
MNTLGQLIGVLLVVGLIIRYFWWIAAVIVYEQAPGWWAARVGAGWRPARDVRLRDHPSPLKGTGPRGSVEAIDQLYSFSNWGRSGIKLIAILRSPVNLASRRAFASNRHLRF